MTYRDLYAILIPERLYERIKEKARQRGVSPDEVYSHVIEHGLENYFMDDVRRELVKEGGIIGIVLSVTDPPDMALRIEALRSEDQTGE